MTQGVLNFESETARKFKEYDEANPQIWVYFKRFALEAIQKGRTRLSAELIYNRIRWETMVRAEDGGFKVNNNARSGYARKFIKEFPQYKDFFETRKCKADL